LFALLLPTSSIHAAATAAAAAIHVLETVFNLLPLVTIAVFSMDGGDGVAAAEKMRGKK